MSDLADALARAIRRDPVSVPDRATLEEGARAPHRKGLRILLTEDNPVNQKVARRILEVEGHSIHVAENGREAVEAIRASAFDLVVMDIQMPVMDGYEATAAIREWEKPSGRRIPILALTARALEGDRERCLEAGMDGYVTKPIRARKLLDAIDELTRDIVLGAARSEGPPREDAPEDRAPERPREESFDLSAALDLLDGDVDLLREMAAIFLEEAPRLISGVEDALASGDRHRIERAAHAIKGTVGSFAAKRAFEAARSVEDAAREGRVQEASEAAAALREEMALLVPALGNLPGRGGPEEDSRA
jgi:CheY-like chemotaxis protein/HPt (histidine-containing phosphotransfer) domain-containing protein